MDIKDFQLDENLDLVIEDGKFAEEDNGASLVKTALFTNSRIADKGGYWLPIASSPLWQLKQFRNDDVTVASKALRVAIKHLEENFDFVLVSSSVDMSGEYVSFRIKYEIDGKTVEETF